MKADRDVSYLQYFVAFWLFLYFDHERRLSTPLRRMVTSELALWVVRFELLSKQSRNTNWNLQVVRSRLKAFTIFFSQFKCIFPYHEVTELKRRTKMCV